MKSVTWCTVSHELIWSSTRHVGPLHNYTV